MSSSILVLLSAVSVTLQITFCLDAVNVDNVVTYCQNKVRKIQATEEIYVRGNVKPGQTFLGLPPYKELQRILYPIDQRQIVFECIGDMLSGISKENLDRSHAYAILVQKCISGRPHIPKCDTSYTYRTLNGTCNNIFHPTWGSTLDCFRRLFSANYEGVSGMRKSENGKRQLPKPRTASLNIVKSGSKPTRDYNTLFAFFGQAVAHDIGEFIDISIKGGEDIDCCRYAGSEKQHPQCLPLLPQPDDPFYPSRNISCLHNVRKAACHSCSPGKRVQINHVTAYVDCSFIYGQTDERAKHLRKNDGSGKMINQHTKAGELMAEENNREIRHRCSREEGGPKEQYCFEKGDDRANQHAVLQILETLLVREHNRLADKLKFLNTHWDEEKLYQEARKILIGEFQVIIYKEFLPLLLGKKLMTKYALSIGTGSEYDFTISPSISIEFNAAAFRLHSLIPGKVVDDEKFEYLRHLYLNAAPIYEDRIHSYLSKMSRHPAEKYDWYMPTDLTHWAVRTRYGIYGFDLAALDIQRGRDVGLPTYPQVIEYIESRPGTIGTFDDLKQYLVPECQRLLEETYYDVRDIDFWMGLNCELVPNDMIISPTAAEIIAEQFRRLKYGDRFFVEHDNTLTDAQRQTLLNASLAKLICDNTKVDAIQPMAMLFPSIENIPKFCSDIPGVDLEKWKD